MSYPKLNVISIYDKEHLLSMIKDIEGNIEHLITINEKLSSENAELQNTEAYKASLINELKEKISEADKTLEELNSIKDCLIITEEEYAKISEWEQAHYLAKHYSKSSPYYGGAIGGATTHILAKDGSFGEVVCICGEKFKFR